MLWPFILILLPLPYPGITTLAEDPAPGIFHSRAEGRNLECKQLSEEEAHMRHPGVVSEPSVRGSFVATRALECRTRIFGEGERREQEEAILDHLSQTTGELASAADTRELAHATWMVDASHSNAAIAGKIAFATKVALAERGRQVSDRVPVLAAGDVLVLSRIKPAQAYPVACARYAAEGSLKASEALLEVAQLDERESTLHAGVCTLGGWQWIR